MYCHGKERMPGLRANPSDAADDAVSDMMEQSEDSELKTSREAEEASLSDLTKQFEKAEKALEVSKNKKSGPDQEAQAPHGPTGMVVDHGADAMVDHGADASHGPTGMVVDHEADAAPAKGRPVPMIGSPFYMKSVFVDHLSLPWALRICVEHLHYSYQISLDTRDKILDCVEHISESVENLPDEFLLVCAAHSIDIWEIKPTLSGIGDRPKAQLPDSTNAVDVSSLHKAEFELKNSPEVVENLRKNEQGDDAEMERDDGYADIEKDEDELQEKICLVYAKIYQRLSREFSAVLPTHPYLSIHTMFDAFGRNILCASDGQFLKGRRSSTPTVEFATELCKGSDGRGAESEPVCLEDANAGDGFYSCDDTTLGKWRAPESSRQHNEIATQLNGVSRGFLNPIQSAFISIFKPPTGLKKPKRPSNGVRERFYASRFNPNDTVERQKEKESPAAIANWTLNRQLLQASTGAGKTAMLYGVVRKFQMYGCSTVWVSQQSTREANIGELQKSKGFPQLIPYYDTAAGKNKPETKGGQRIKQLLEQAKARRIKKQGADPKDVKKLREAIAQEMLRQHDIWFITYTQFADIINEEQIFDDSSQDIEVRQKSGMKTLIANMSRKLLLIFDEGHILFNPGSEQEIEGPAAASIVRARHTIADWPPSTSNVPLELAEVLLFLKGHPFTTGMGLTVMPGTPDTIDASDAVRYGIVTYREAGTTHLDSCPPLNKGGAPTEANKYWITNKELFAGLCQGSLAWIDTSVDVYVERKNPTGEFPSLKREVVLVTQPNIAQDTNMDALRKKWGNVFGEVEVRTVHPRGDFYKVLNNWVASHYNELNDVNRRQSILDTTITMNALNIMNNTAKAWGEGKRDLEDKDMKSLCPYDKKKKVAEAPDNKIVATLDGSSLNGDQILDILACYSPKLGVILEDIEKDLMEKKNKEERRPRGYVVPVPVGKVRKTPLADTGSYNVQDEIIETWATIAQTFFEKGTRKGGPRAVKSFIRSLELEYNRSEADKPPGADQSDDENDSKEKAQAKRDILEEFERWDDREPPKNKCAVIALKDMGNKRSFNKVSIDLWQSLWDRIIESDTDIDYPRIIFVSDKWYQSIDLFGAGSLYLLYPYPRARLQQVIGRVVRRRSHLQPIKPGIAPKAPHAQGGVLLKHVVYNAELEPLACDYLYAAREAAAQSPMAEATRVSVKSSWYSAYYRNPLIFKAYAVENMLKMLGKGAFTPYPVLGTHSETRDYAKRLLDAESHDRSSKAPPVSERAQRAVPRFAEPAIKGKASVASVASGRRPDKWDAGPFARHGPEGPLPLSGRRLRTGVHRLR